jgi:hypothetical protein
MKVGILKEPFEMPILDNSVKEAILAAAHKFASPVTISPRYLFKFTRLVTRFGQMATSIWQLDFVDLAQGR